MRKIPQLIFLTLLATPHWVAAQTEPVREHIYVTDNMASHLFLKLHVPAGELFVRESKECGIAHTRIVSPDTSTKWLLSHRPSPDGNLYQEAVVQAREPGASSQAALRQVYRVDPMASQHEARAVKSEYCLDPRLSTDLSLYLGHGSSMLDLSNLSLNNLSIESTFSDLVLTYSKPNQTPMQKLHIHAANANIVLKHLELARASFIHVQNDMGDTKLMLGSEINEEGEENPVIELRNGVGDCLIVVDKTHPVRIVVNKGVLAKADPDEASGFQKMRDRSQLTFQNESAENLDDREITMIHCDLDFGELILFSR